MIARAFCKFFSALQANIMMYFIFAHVKKMVFLQILAPFPQTGMHMIRVWVDMQDDSRISVYLSYLLGKVTNWKASISFHPLLSQLLSQQRFHRLLYEDHKTGENLWKVSLTTEGIVYPSRKHLALRKKKNPNHKNNLHTTTQHQTNQWVL